MRRKLSSKRNYAGCLLMVLGGLVVVSSFAQPALRPLPPLLHTLSDEVGVLSPEEGRKLSRAIEDVFDRTGVRIVMVIAETTAPEAVEDYGERLAQRWKRERGIEPARSIFVVLAVRDREMQVMPGKGLESLDRELARSEALADLGPLFRERRYFEALMKLNGRLFELIRKHKPSSETMKGPGKGPGRRRNVQARRQS